MFFGCYVRHPYTYVRRMCRILSSIYHHSMTHYIKTQKLTANAIPGDAWLHIAHWLRNPLPLRNIKRHFRTVLGPTLASWCHVLNDYSVEFDGRTNSPPPRMPNKQTFPRCVNLTILNDYSEDENATDDESEEEEDTIDDENGSVIVRNAWRWAVDAVSNFPEQLHRLRLDLVRRAWIKRDAWWRCRRPINCWHLDLAVLFPLVDAVAGSLRVLHVMVDDHPDAVPTETYVVSLLRRAFGLQTLSFELSGACTCTGFLPVVCSTIRDGGNVRRFVWDRTMAGDDAWIFDDAYSHDEDDFAVLFFARSAPRRSPHSHDVDPPFSVRYSPASSSGVAYG